METPTGSIKRFGVALVGPKFEWASLPSEDGEIEIGEYRARHALNFEELVEYNALGAYISAEAVVSAREMGDALKKINEPVEEGGEKPDAMATVREITEKSNEDERRRWDMIVNHTLMCVAATDVDRLRPLLEAGNPADVRDLRDWLKRVVVDHLPDEVETAANVDPTLPPSESDSPSTPESGEPSASEA